LKGKSNGLKAKAEEKAKAKAPAKALWMGL